MIVKILEKIGTAKAEKGVVGNYKKHPDSLTAAANAAVYYANKNNQDLLLVPGNSYMRKVYHIALKSERIQKYTGFQATVLGALVTMDGEVFKAELS